MTTGEISIINTDKLCKTCKGTGKILVFQPRGKVKVCPECKGERPEKAPVTPPTTLPKEGEFISALNALDKEYLSTLHAVNKVYSNELTFRVLSAHNRDMKAARTRIAELELDFKQSKENAETNAKLLNEALAKIAALKAINAELTAGVAELSEKNSELEDVNIDLVEQNANLETTRNKYETLNLTLSEDLRTANQRIVGLEDRIACQIPALQQVNKKLEGELSVSRLANESLRKRIAILEAQIPKTVRPVPESMYNRQFKGLKYICPDCEREINDWDAPFCYCGVKLDWSEGDA